MLEAPWAFKGMIKVQEIQGIGSLCTEEFMSFANYL
jgi:hypothetical protein